MGLIKKLNELELVGGTEAQDIYPVTSTLAVYDQNGKNLDDILSDIEAGGGGGDIPLASRTIIAFTSSEEAPKTPEGGSWDLITNEVILPAGWSNDDRLTPPIWMSTGEFLATAPNNPKWSLPMPLGGEGVNGVDGVNLEFIFKLTKNDLDKPSNPVNFDQTGYVPEGWTGSPTGISAEMQVEWVCTRKKDETGEHWLNWSKPAIWSKWGVNGLDGDGVEYIYKVNRGEPLENPTPSDTSSDQYQEKGEYENIEYVPTELGWSDNPKGVSIEKTHEWICVRKRIKGVWSAYSGPTLWAKWGEKGKGGVSLRTMYRKTKDSSTIPNVVVDNINPGSEWNLVFPDYTGVEAVWSIQAYITYDGQLATVEDDTGLKIFGWQGPWICTGANGKDGTPVNYKTYMYKKSDSKPDKPTFNDPLNPTEGWVDFPTGPGQWWQSVGDVIGATGLILKWSSVIPLNGRDGIAQDGKWTEMRFKVSKEEKLTLSEIDKAERDLEPKGWFMQAPYKAEDEYLFMISATINPNDTLNGLWSDPVRISGERGPKGEKGPAGEKGPIGSQGISGIPGVSFEVRYCLGVLDKPDGTTSPSGEKPSGWDTVVPTTNDFKPYIWCLQGRRIYLSANSSDIAWEKPFKLNGTIGLKGKDGNSIKLVDVEYASSTSSIEAPIEGWTTDAPAWGADKYIWSRNRIDYENNIPSTYSNPVCISGGEGPKGNSGVGVKSITEYYYRSNSSLSLTGGSWNTSRPDWINGKYMWTKSVIEYTDDTSKETTPICVTGESGPRGSQGPGGPQGPRGPQGSIGPRGYTGLKGQLVYPAGIYGSGKSYTCNETTAPYVYYSGTGKFYVLNTQMKWDVDDQYPLNPSNSSDWVEFKAFEAIYAEIGIFGNALVGSAVFNGDWVFSQQGSGNYENFNGDPINGPFKPNVCINFKTGEMWTSQGKVKFAKDGSGYVANGNVKWNSLGEVTLSSKSSSLGSGGSIANNQIQWSSNYVKIGDFYVRDGALSTSLDPNTGVLLGGAGYYVQSGVERYTQMDVNGITFGPKCNISHLSVDSGTSLLYTTGFIVSGGSITLPLASSNEGRIIFVKCKGNTTIYSKSVVYHAQSNDAWEYGNGNYYQSFPGRSLFFISDGSAWYAFYTYAAK